MLLPHIMLVVATFAAATAPLQPSLPRQHIYGGEAVAPCQWPFVVAVHGGCSGVLITAEHVLTAAHCRRGAEYVVFGEDASDPQRQVSIDACEPLPGGEPGQGNDLMVCTLKSPQAVPAVPVLSPEEAGRLEPGTPVHLVGFGESEDGTVGVKRAVAATLGEQNAQGERQIGGDGRDSCHGDSGGPALVQLGDAGWRVVGITSYGLECGAGGWYAQPHRHASWLADQTQTEICAPRWRDEGRDGDWRDACLPPEGLVDDPCAARGGDPRCAVQPSRGPSPTLVAALVLLAWVRRLSRPR